MRTMLFLVLALVLTGAAYADGQGLLVSARKADGTTVIRMIPVCYLDLTALCQALGGTVINLYGTATIGQNAQPANRFNMPGMPQAGYQPGMPQSGGLPGQPTGGATGGAIGAPPGALSGGTLNPNAPLAPFIPAGVQTVVGMQM